MTSDHYLNSMIIKALLDNGIKDPEQVKTVAQQHMPTIKRIFDDSGLTEVEISDSLNEQLSLMISDYFSQIPKSAKRTKKPTTKKGRSKV